MAARTSTSTVHLSLEGSQIRDIALGRALQLHTYETKADTVVATAKAFETYLTTGPRRTHIAADIAEPRDADAVEAARLRVEQLPLDGEPKKTLSNVDLAYRIELLATILLDDPNETPADKQAALDELRSTVNDFVDVFQDGAE